MMAKKNKTLRTGRALGNERMMRDEKVKKKRQGFGGNLAITVDQPSPGANTPPLVVSGTFTGSPPYPTITAMIVIGTNPCTYITGAVTVNGNAWTFTPAQGCPTPPLNTPMSLIVTNKNDLTSSMTVPFTLTEPTMTLGSIVTSQPIVTLTGTTNSPNAVTALGGTFVVEQLPNSTTFSVTSHVPGGFPNAKLQLQTTDATGNTVNFPSLTFAVISAAPTATAALNSKTGVIDVTYSNSMADSAFQAAGYLLQDGAGGPVYDAKGTPVTVVSVSNSLFPTDALLTLSAPPVTGTYRLLIGTAAPVTDQAGNPYVDPGNMMIAFP
jgi:hypothetical protein